MALKSNYFPLSFLSADADYGRRIAEKLAILAKKRQEPVERLQPFPLNPPRTVPLRGNL
ncbi:MAG: hypothetical protein GY696_24740 [Gammaproteobacteria bacterium]|nr:hypothetical protein [Gammaproteobacteria bacterium]